ncbi:MAG: hypothetical protein LBJ14_04900 [Desulfarculales bacterium]|nr:hypothetical protein [Desulfarculales bacterium]
MALPDIKKNKFWLWKAYCRTTGQLVDWECGRRDAAKLNNLLERLKRLNVSVYFADNWEAYAELIPHLQDFESMGRLK